MVTSFLNFARPQPLQLDEVSLDELIADCAGELGSIFQQLKVELVITGSAPAETDGAGDSSERNKLLIRADERMLRQALLNLIRNAGEAIPESQSDRRVEVTSSTDRDSAGQHWAVIRIKDTGEGIPAADLQRIFIPFFTTKAMGHGVGLALAHRVITQHGGTLTASNGKEGGAVFSVRLPA
jgi:signal transduction histidine kinase